MTHRRFATGWPDWRLDLGFRGTHARLGCNWYWRNIMALRIGTTGRRGHVWLLLPLLFRRLGSVVGLRGSCRFECVPIWADLIIAWFCGLVCRGGAGGGGPLTRAFEIRYHCPEGVGGYLPHIMRTALSHPIVGGHAHFQPGRG